MVTEVTPGEDPMGVWPTVQRAMDVAERVGYLKKDRQERFNLKRAWFVNAWRVVDANGVDFFQPWESTKADARNTAKKLGIKLIEEDK